MTVCSHVQNTLKHSSDTDLKQGNSNIYCMAPGGQSLSHIKNEIVRRQNEAGDNCKEDQ